MGKDNKSAVICVLIAALIIIGSIVINSYKNQTLLKTMENTLQDYFENNNIHISSRGFDINNVTIRCRGNKAYIVEFDLILDNADSNQLNRLAATIYKNKKEWNVKGFGSGLTNKELELYNFKCYEV